MTLDQLLALLPDNDIGAIDAVNLRVIVTELWDDNASLETRVAALEASNGGSPTTQGIWQVNSNPGAVPGGTQVTASDAVWENATWLRFAKVDISNTDLSLALMNATRIFGQKQMDASTWARFDVFDTPVDAGSYIEIPVSWTDGGGDASSVAWQTAVVVITVDWP